MLRIATQTPVENGDLAEMADQDHAFDALVAVGRLRSSEWCDPSVRGHDRLIVLADEERIDDGAGAEGVARRLTTPR